MAKTAKKRISAAHRKALIAGQRRRRAKERGGHEPVLAVAQTSPRSSSTKGRRKHGTKKMPEGLHLLRRSGGGKDIIEGDACEISAAVRFWRETKEKFAQ